MFGALSFIDKCHPTPWLSRRNVKGLMDDEHGMATALELGCADETGAIEVLNIFFII